MKRYSYMTDYDRPTKLKPLLGKYKEGDRFHNTHDNLASIHELFWEPIINHWCIAYVMGSHRYGDYFHRLNGDPEEIKSGLVKTVHPIERKKDLEKHGYTLPCFGYGVLRDGFDVDFEKWWEPELKFKENNTLHILNKTDHIYNEITGDCGLCDVSRTTCEICNEKMDEGNRVKFRGFCLACFTKRSKEAIQKRLEVRAYYAGQEDPSRSNEDNWIIANIREVAEGQRNYEQDWREMNEKK